MTSPIESGIENDNPSVTVALSTVAKKLHLFGSFLADLINQSDQDFELLIIIQSLDKNAVSKMKSVVENANPEFEVRFHVSEEKGLLKSRNIALKYSKGEYILLADDDCRYRSDAIMKIKTVTSRFPNSEILTFQAVTPGGELLNPRNNPTKDEKHNCRTIMSVCSIEVVIKNSLKEESDRVFDERFGLGTKFNTGGENIMLMDALRKGVIVTRHPQIVVTHPVGSSGTGSGGISQLAFAKGAMFRRMFGGFGLFVLMVFLLKGTFRVEKPRYMPWHYFHAIAGFVRAPRIEKGVNP